MKITYTAHLEFRVKVRNIPRDLPSDVFRQAREHYYDNATKHYIAVHEAEFEGKNREMAVTYDQGKDAVEIITIHPIKSYQKQGRILSGRWKRL